MPRTVERRIGWIGAVAILLFIGVSALALWNTQRLVNTSHWVAHTDDVIVELEALHFATENAESNIRAYALTGNPGDLAAYDESGAEVIAHIGQLRVLVVDNSTQQHYLDRLQAALLPVMASMGALRRGRTAHGERPATAMIATEHERTTMRVVQDTLTLMREEERRLQSERTARTEEINQHTALILALASALGALAMTAALRLLMRHERSRAAAERALRASEVRLRLIIDNMLAGLIIIAADGTIELVNPAAQHIFGCTADDLVGHHAEGLIVLPDRGAGDDDRVVGLVPRRALGQVTEWQGRRRDGGTFPLELALYEFETEGQQRHFAAIARDISERHEIGRMKDEFVSVVSHELRTPLTSMRGSLQLVLVDPPIFNDPEQEPLLGIALSNCERLIRIINDILDVSKIDAGEMELKCLPCDAASAVRTSIQNVAGMARGAQVRINTDLDETLPPLFADFDRLVQVLVNLLSNAIKFAPAHSIVTVRTHAAGDQIAISVQDHGVGIAAHDLDQLFQRFKQLDSSDTRRRGGTGLGLAIAKALVEQHNGHVSVDSQPGDGATFTVTIPIAHASREQEARRSAPSAVPAA
jgi:PAS domain S-box-containing protein